MTRSEQEFQTHSDLLDAELEKASREIDGHRAKLADDFALRSLASQRRRNLPGLDEALEHAADIADGFEYECCAYRFLTNSYKGFRPLSDQVLVRPLPAQDRISSSSLIVIPGSHDRGRLEDRLGVVLALGPGDPVAEKCPRCMGAGSTDGFCFNIKTNAGCTVRGLQCEGCQGTGFTGNVVRTPFEVQVGDTILVANRYWADIMIDGEMLAVVHDCQHIIGVVDPDSVLFAEDSTTKKKGPDWVR